MIGLDFVADDDPVEDCVPIDDLEEEDDGVIVLVAIDDAVTETDFNMVNVDLVDFVEVFDKVELRVGRIAISARSLTCFTIEFLTSGRLA